MNALYMTIPLALLIAFAALVFFIYTLRSGQYEDMEGPKYRMLFDEDEEGKKGRDG